MTLGISLSSIIIYDHNISEMIIMSSSVYLDYSRSALTMYLEGKLCRLVVMRLEGGICRSLNCRPQHRISCVNFQLYTMGAEYRIREICWEI